MIHKYIFDRKAIDYASWLKKKSDIFFMVIRILTFGKWKRLWTFVRYGSMVFVLRMIFCLRLKFNLLFFIRTLYWFINVSMEILTTRLFVRRDNIIYVYLPRCDFSFPSFDNKYTFFISFIWKTTNFCKVYEGYISSKFFWYQL